MNIQRLDKPKEKLFMFRLSDSDRSIQKSAAASVGLSESEFVRQAVSEKIWQICVERSSTQQRISQ
jgi:hypothetical protein